MKKITFLLVALLTVTMSFGQNSKLRLAQTSLEDGDLQDAKEAIDAASVHKKTKDDPETWALKALIYSNIQASGINEILKIEGVQDTTLSALDKAKSLDTNGEYAEKIADAAQRVINLTHNAGVVAYSDTKDYQEAINQFTNKQKLMEKYTPTKTDTIGTVIIGSSYINLDQPDKAIPYYEKAVELGYQDKGIYYGLTRFYKDKDEAKYLNYLEMAQANFPDEKNFQLLEIDYKLSKGKGAEMLAELKTAFEDNPDNVNLPLVISSIYEAKEDYKNQLVWTKKALEIEPNNFVANLNTGVAYFNQAVNFNNEINFMSSDTSQEYKDKKAKRDELASQAKIYFDKAHELDPESEKAVQALIEYHRMYENEAKVNELIESLK